MLGIIVVVVILFELIMHQACFGSCMAVYHAMYRYAMPAKASPLCIRRVVGAPPAARVKSEDIPKLVMPLSAL